MAAMNDLNTAYDVEGISTVKGIADPEIMPVAARGIAKSQRCT